MILFESTTSVFELIWDIAIAFYIVRLAFFYFGLSFLTGCTIASLHISNPALLNHFTHPQSLLFLSSIWLGFSTLWARFIIATYEIPRVAWFRVAIGGIALLFMLMAGLICDVLMYEEGLTEWIWETNMVVNIAGSVAFLVFGLTPLMLMGFEPGYDATHETSHGFEEKSVTDAMPSVVKVKKIDEREKKGC